MPSIRRALDITRRAQVSIGDSCISELVLAERPNRLSTVAKHFPEGVEVGRPGNRHAMPTIATDRESCSLMMFPTVDFGHCGCERGRLRASRSVRASVQLLSARPRELPTLTRLGERLYGARSGRRYRGCLARDSIVGFWKRSTIASSRQGVPAGGDAPERRAAGVPEFKEVVANPDARCPARRAKSLQACGRDRSTAERWRRRPAGPQASAAPCGPLTAARHRKRIEDDHGRRHHVVR